MSQTAMSNSIWRNLRTIPYWHVAGWLAASGSCSLPSLWSVRPTNKCGTWGWLVPYSFPPSLRQRRPLSRFSEPAIAEIDRANRTLPERNTGCPKVPAPTLLGFSIVICWHNEISFEPCNLHITGIFLTYETLWYIHRFMSYEWKLFSTRFLQN